MKLFFVTITAILAPLVASAATPAPLNCTADVGYTSDAGVNETIILKERLNPEGTSRFGSAETQDARFSFSANSWDKDAIRLGIYEKLDDKGSSKGAAAKIGYTENTATLEYYTGEADPKTGYIAGAVIKLTCIRAK